MSNGVKAVVFLLKGNSLKILVLLLPFAFLFGCTSTNLYFSGLEDNPFIPSGETYHINHDSNTIVITTSAVWYYGKDWNAGKLNGFNFADSNLIVQYPGKYLINYSASFASNGSNQTYGTTILVNNLPAFNCYTERTITVANSIGNVGATCLLYLKPGDKIVLGFEDEGVPPANIKLYAANFTACMIE